MSMVESRASRLHRSDSGPARWRCVLRILSACLSRFVDQFLTHFKVDGGKFHIAGTSNGGVSAFYAAARYPSTSCT